MEPNTNQQGTGANGQPAGLPQPPHEWPAESPLVPDWQQGLSTNAVPRYQEFPQNQHPLQPLPYETGQPPQVPAQPPLQSLQQFPQQPQFQPQYQPPQPSHMPWEPISAATPLPNPNPISAAMPAPEPTRSPMATPLPLAPMATNTRTLGPDGPEPLSPQAPPKRNGLLVFIVLTILVVATAAVGAYLLIARDEGADPNGDMGNGSLTDTNAAALSSVKDMTFGLPNDLSLFKGDSSTVAAYHLYLTQGSADDKACSLEFGVATAAQLPGDTFDNILNPQIDALKKAGASVTGPSAGAELVLKDFTDSKKSYSLPTLHYEYTQGTKQVSVRYSLAILKGGKRAFVGRQCSNNNGAVDAATLSKVEAAAKQISINKQ